MKARDVLNGIYRRVGGRGEKRPKSASGARSGWTPHAAPFVALAAGLNTALFHLPLFSFATRNLSLATGTGVLTMATLVIGVYLASLVLLIAPALLSHRVLKPFCMLILVGNATALYFLVAYQVVLDETMMGNVLNTRFGEAAAFLNPGLIACVLLLGALPCWLLARVRIQASPRRRLLAMLAVGFPIAAAWAWLCGAAWPWIDAHSKQVGGLILPWSYVINAARYEAPRLFVSGVPTLLPPASFSSDDRTVVVLVIGEAARARNFQLYGYERATNPLLSGSGVVPLRNTTACATYTTAAVRCILSDVGATSPWSRSHEPLPSYLQRHGVDVIWRTHNFGEPPIHVETYQTASDLARDCVGPGCRFDEVLLTGLEERIRASTSRRVLVILHQAGSHGPDYYRHYPESFSSFRPVCRSVELSQCTGQSLVNSYDNTILYEDYFLSRAIGVLQRLQHTSSLMIYVSDHGESLGEYGFYLHGVPWSIAPDVQKDIPFIVWMSGEFMRGKGVSPGRLASQTRHSQRDIFHSVMGAFSMHSDAYDPAHDIFSASFADQ